MQKICAIILLTALVSNYEALPQTKWSRQLRNPQGQLIRERRQFPFGEWIPLSQPCPTCRPFADPLDAGLKVDNIGLTPPRPPTVTRQIHAEGNFFPRDESSILSVPPPPPSAIPRHPIGGTNGNFQNLQFNNFAQQFNNPLTVPTQQIFPQTQQIQFLPQTFLPNQPLLVNNNPQILPVLNGQNTLFGQENQGKQQINNGKVPKFNSEFKQPKPTENVLLEQNKRPTPAAARPETQFRNKPTPFTAPQQQQNQQQTFAQHHQQQGFVQQQQQPGFIQQQQQQQGFVQQQQGFAQQPLIQQQQHSVNFGDSILTPPPAPNVTGQNVVIPGLDKEEIQLLYVPVETLRQRGNFQEQLITQQPQNIQFHNRPSASPSPVSPQLNQQTTTKQNKGHFVTQEGNNNREQSISTLKVTSAQPFPTTVTPSSLLLQHLPFQQTPQSFVSATPVTPATPTIQPFVTPSSSPSKFSSFTPETTLSHLSTIPNAIQFSQPGFEFGTTAKSIFQDEIINGKSQFSNFKEPTFQGVQFQQQQQPQVNLQQQQQQHSFVNQQQQNERPPQHNTVFLQQGQQQQKDIQLQNVVPKQQLQDQQQTLIQKQQEQQRLLQQQKEKDLQQKYLLERQQKEAEAQRLLAQQQRQKELEEQRILQQMQRQKELEEQRLLQQQRQKELDEQRLLQQQKQKELEEQRYLQQQKQKELEEQRFLQQQRQRELENQRQLQLQRQRELEEKRRLQLQKQREQEEQQRLLRLQQQQKELEEQRLLQQQQEQEQQQRLYQQQLQKQNQENLKKQQQYQFIQQQQQQQQTQQEALQKPNRHTLPVNDKLNSIAQLAKESEPDDSTLVPHQPPLSVFFRGYDGAQPRILDVLRELRNSKTITVLDQYFEKMPKVFVGPAGLIPPAGYGKFELPYLSNLETNRIERKIDRLPFFVAPLNFIPPPGYSKIPFPAPHVGSVVISSENNPAMKQQSIEKENVASTEENNDSGSYPVVGPEIPGLVNSLETETTTFKPTVFSSTPSLPQTTAQLRNRRPNSSLYRPQNRKPISKPRPQTTSKPEEEVTQPAQKTEKESETGIRKPFNRFLKRRRPQAKTTTESPVTNDQEGKNLENRFYSVDAYQKQKNTNNLRQHQFQEKQGSEPNQYQQQASNIDRTTPQGQNVYDVQPTPGFYKSEPSGSATESDERRPQILDYSGVNNLQTYEDGPFPTGSAKTITHELYRPNALRPTLHHQQQQYDDSTSSKFQPKPVTSAELEKIHGVPENPRLTDISEVNPTAAFVGTTGQKSSVAQDAVKIQPTSETGFERQDITLGSSEKYYGNEGAYNPSSITAPEEQKPTGFSGSDEQYTSGFADISKNHHIPSSTELPQRHQPQYSPDSQSSPEIAQHLQAPFSEQHFAQEQHSQEFGPSGQANPRPTPNTVDLPNPQFSSVGPSSEQYSADFAGVSNNEQTSGFANVPQGQVSPTASGVSQEQYTTGFSVNSNSPNAPVDNTKDLRRPSFINFHNNQGTPEPTEKSRVQYFPTSSEGQPQEYGTITETVQNYDYPKVVEQNYAPVTPETLPQASEAPSTQNYKQESVSEDLAQISEQKQTTEGQGQNFDDNLSNTHRLKISNPSIVKVRTRVRGKPRGQLNFVASQTTTQAPYTRSKAENKNVDNTEQEYATKTNNFRDYQPVKVSKYNQYRGLKKPVRPTTEAATEHEQKANVYTIRPQRRPSSPSTVSTKRIRRPTTPVPSPESSSEGIRIATPGSQSHADEAEFSPSGVSNDVYYEHTSFSPIRNKFRKHFGTPEEKSDVVPSYTPTAYPSTIRTHLSTIQAHSSEEVNVIKDFVQPQHQENDGKYPEWNPAESSIDVSGIVLTTTGAPAHNDQLEVEEPKKSQDSKKAFDPDLEKKSGRRRVRVRVHKRPHENFETAESQNLRTVANVLVPPTSTYKPNDESNVHQLVKNSDYSFGGQKSYGIRSRDYFRKRLNLTQTERNEVKQDTTDDAEEGNAERRQPIRTQADGQEEIPVTAGGNSGERLHGTKIRGYVRKVEKSQKKENESALNQSSEDNGSGNVANKTGRTKFRGYVRKVIKHGDSSRDSVNESSQAAENGEVEAKQDNVETPVRQHFRGNHTFSQNGRGNGTRHRTFVRYVKKNKVRTHGTESQQESDAHQREEQVIHQTTESHTEQPKIQLTEVSEPQTESQQSNESEIPQTQYPVYHSTEQPSTEIKQAEELEVLQTLKPVQTSEKESETEQTEQPESRQTPEIITETTQEPESDHATPEKFHETEESEVRQTQPTEAPKTQETVQQYTQRTKYYQTLRPISQRTQYTGFHRTTETHTSTTERVAEEVHEKRDGPVRPKYDRNYGKTTGYGTTGSESKFEESKKTNEHHLEQQNRNKNSHIFEIRKYLRTKNREGAFSQFSKNRYFTSEKTETVDTSKENSNEDNKSSEEITTPIETAPTASEPKTTNTFTPNEDSAEVHGETTKNDESVEANLTTEEIETSTEVANHEDEPKDITGSVHTETTTEENTDLPTTLFQNSDRTDQITESKTETIIPTERNEISQTETQPDLYRFSKSSFSFDETEKFTGTKNRAHVRNITADILENTASFSAPGIDKHSDNHVVSTDSDENAETITESHSDVSTNEKTEDSATELNNVVATTEYQLDNVETESTAATEAVTKAKIAKLIKTSTTTKVSHETEICYKGKCIRTKSENPDEDLKLLVDSASTMKIEKPKT